jgi:hypothetical protein
VTWHCTGRWRTALATFLLTTLLLLLPGHMLQGDVALHWPLVDSPGRLLQQLGQQELEAKRKEDGAAYLASLPGYRWGCPVKLPCTGLGVTGNYSVQRGRRSIFGQPASRQVRAL